MLLPFLNKKNLEAGLDEAGRGCLAGPVVAAAVILDPKKPILGLNDSKKLSEKKRLFLKQEIEEKALAYAVAFVSQEEIDEINILNASFLAMHRSVDALNIKPNHLLIDGNRFNAYPTISHTCIIKGDGKYMSIAAASILAKTARDIFMEEAHRSYPYYNWKKNKGYPTKEHRVGIIQFGSCPLHRQSFTLLSKQTELPFDKH